VARWMSRVLRAAGQPEIQAVNANKSTRRNCNDRFDISLPFLRAARLNVLSFIDWHVHGLSHALVYLRTSPTGKLLCGTTGSYYELPTSPPFSFAHLGLRPRFGGAEAAQMVLQLGDELGPAAGASGAGLAADAVDGIGVVLHVKPPRPVLNDAGRS